MPHILLVQLLLPPDPHKPMRGPSKRPSHEAPVERMPLGLIPIRPCSALACRITSDVFGHIVRDRNLVPSGQLPFPASDDEAEAGSGRPRSA